MKIAAVYGLAAPVLATVAGMECNDRFRASLGTPGVLRCLLVLAALRVRRLFWRFRLCGTRPTGVRGSPREANAPATGGGASAPRPDSVPSILFQTWKSREVVPFNYGAWSATLRRWNPDFEYRLWDDADNRRFIAEHYPWFLETYDAYPREIYRADAVRYFFLYHYGGVYADMDTEGLRPLAPLFRSGDVWLCRMGTDDGFAHSIPNAIMASRPRQDFWLLAIHFMLQSARQHASSSTLPGPEEMTGPVVLKRTYDTYVSAPRTRVIDMVTEVVERLPVALAPSREAARIVLLDSHCWYPLDWSNPVHYKLKTELGATQTLLGGRLAQWLFPHSYMVTYWTHSWGTSG